MKFKKPNKKGFPCPSKDKLILAERKWVKWQQGPVSHASPRCLLNIFAQGNGEKSWIGMSGNAMHCLDQNWRSLWSRIRWQWIPPPTLQEWLLISLSMNLLGYPQFSPPPLSLSIYVLLTQLVFVSLQASFDGYLEDKPRVFKAIFPDKGRSRQLNEVFVIFYAWSFENWVHCADYWNDLESASSFVKGHLFAWHVKPRMADKKNPSLNGLLIVYAVKN